MHTDILPVLQGFLSPLDLLLCFCSPFYLHPRNQTFQRGDNSCSWTCSILKDTFSLKERLSTKYSTNLLILIMKVTKICVTQHTTTQQNVGHRYKLLVLDTWNITSLVGKESEHLQEVYKYFLQIHSTGYNQSLAETVRTCSLRFSQALK